MVLASGVMNVANAFILRLTLRPGFRFTIMRGISSSNEMSPSVNDASAPTRRPLLVAIRVITRSRRLPILSSSFSSSLVGMRSSTTTSSPGNTSAWILGQSISTSFSISHFLKPPRTSWTQVLVAMSSSKRSPMNWSTMSVRSSTLIAPTF